MRFATVVFAIFVLIASPLLVRADQGILVDRSGSMKSYYQSGLVNDLVRKIADVLARHGTTQVIAFSDDVKRVQSVDDIVKLSWGKYTYLDKSIDFAIGQQHAIVWMITDNIQDQPGAPEIGNTEVFYQRLRGEAVSKVVIFPLVQAPGTPGIAIYAMLLSKEADETFAEEVKEFLDSVKGTYQIEALRMKPLDRDTVEISFVRGKLQPGKVTVVYKEGQDVRETLEIRFRSRFEHLKIVDAQLEVPEARAEFGPSSLLTPEKKEIKITPVTVPSLEPQGETEQVYSVSVDMGKIKLKQGFAPLWRAA